MVPTIDDRFCKFDLARPVCTPPGPRPRASTGFRPKFRGLMKRNPQCAQPCSYAADTEVASRWPPLKNQLPAERRRGLPRRLAVGCGPGSAARGISESNIRAWLYSSMPSLSDDIGGSLSPGRLVTLMVLDFGRVSYLASLPDLTGLGLTPPGGSWPRRGAPSRSAEAARSRCVCQLV